MHGRKKKRKKLCKKEEGRKWGKGKEKGKAAELRCDGRIWIRASPVSGLHFIKIRQTPGVNSFPNL